MRLLAGLVVAAALAAAATPDIHLSEGRFVLTPAPDPGDRDWADVFAVYVVTSDGVPPVAGSYRVVNGDLVFEPRYPLTGGVSYRAVAGSLSRVFEIPRARTEPTTIVEAVYPSADVVPENLLKFYIQFSAPMSRGEAYSRIRLLDEQGQAVARPFLELDQELWNAAGTRFTLFFDPGRIKSGLVPHQELGLALHQGRAYTLVIDAAWHDGDGVPLTQPFAKRLRVGPPDDTTPDVKTWRLTSPKAGTTEPLRVDFPEPLDHALLERVVRVTTPDGRPIPGDVRVENGETRWLFLPAEPWKPETYHLQAESILEDLAGNSLSKPFEVDVFEKVEDRVVGKAERLRFTPVQ